MRKIGLRNLKIGMRIAQSVFSPAGSIVVPAGTLVSEQNLERLIQLGISELFIDDPRVADIEIPESITDDTRVRTMALLKGIFDGVRSASRLEDIPLPFDDIRRAVEDIDGDLSHSGSDIINFIPCNSIDQYPEISAINVAMLSIMVAKRAGLGARVLDVGIGALLRDIGMMLIPDSILKKPSRLSAAEYERVQKHPEIGLKILRLTSRFSAFSRAIVYQHQERHDGSGYPRGLKGQEIDPLARIVSVADTYSALVSRRPHRAAMAPQEAFEYLMSSAGFEYDHQTVQGCLLYVAPYPIGTMVRLNTGEKGVVTHVTKGLTTRPLVRVFFDSAGNQVADTYEINLAAPENQTKLVVETCDD